MGLGSLGGGLGRRLGLYGDFSINLGVLLNVFGTVNLGMLQIFFPVNLSMLGYQMLGINLLLSRRISVHLMLLNNWLSINLMMLLQASITKILVSDINALRSVSLMNIESHSVLLYQNL